MSSGTSCRRPRSRPGTTNSSPHSKVGVSRIDLTNEYFRGAREHRLGYRTLKSLARNALVYSFLTEQEKQQELSRFDRSSAGFEASITSQQGWPRRLGMLILEAVAP